MRPDIFSVNGIDSLAQYLKIEAGDLIELLYPEKTNNNNYIKFRIPKKSGEQRTITAPKSKLKSIQRKIRKSCENLYVASDNAHGFISGRSILSNATPHARRPFLISLDIENFFPSITIAQITMLFEQAPFYLSKNGATLLALLCTHDGRLPQGAPTSPILSNIFCLRFDAQLNRLAEDIGYTYTRYVDDISFSPQDTSHGSSQIIIAALPNGKFSPSTRIQQIAADNGLSFNISKTRISHQWNRMNVTGLTVNEFPNIPRSFINRTRSMLYAWRKWGYENAQREHFEKYRGLRKSTSFRNIVRGRLAYIKMIRGSKDYVFQNLQAQFSKLDIHTS